MKPLVIAAVMAALLPGCASKDMQMKAPAAQAQSVPDQIAAIQNDPNMPPDAKARTIAQLQGGSRVAGGKVAPR